jgi:hypothetical protein
MAEVKYLEVFAPTGRKRMVDGVEKDEYWPKIGVAFPMKSGMGFSIKLDSLPLNGELVVKPPRPKEDKGEGGI